MTETDLEFIVVLLALLCAATGALAVALWARVRHRARTAAEPNDLDLRLGIGTVIAVHPNDHQVAVRAAFDRMLIRKGLATAAHLDLIRHGIRTRGVVTAMRCTGVTREDHREVELDMMVRRPHGGQFPAHERTLVPVSAAVAPGSIIDTYYRPGDESRIAVCVPPGSTG